MIVRKHMRLEVQLEVSFRVEGDAEDRTFRGSTKNISRGGACILVERDKAAVASLMGDRLPRLAVSIFLDKQGGNLLVDVPTKTAWISSKVGWYLTPANERMPLLVGASFDSVSREDTEKIDFFIEELIRADGDSIGQISSRILNRMRRRSGGGDGG